MGDLGTVWRMFFSPGGNTPHWAKAQRLFPLALLSWKKECRSEYRKDKEEMR